MTTMTVTRTAIQAPASARTTGARTTPGARSGSAMSAARSGLRLTRRGRIVLALTGSLVAFVLLGLGHLPSTQASDQSTTLPATTSVVVHPGETLWQIAVRIAPNTDPRKTVHVLEELNGLSTADVQAGQSLRIPA